MNRPMTLVKTTLPILLIFACTFGVAAADDSPPGRLAMFRSPLHKFEISYPVDWQSLPQFGARMVVHD